jgi:hypothetical protein
MLALLGLPANALTSIRPLPDAAAMDIFLAFATPGLVRPWQVGTSAFDVLVGRISI